ncbi:substrate-binding periplasmic protein [Pseudomonas sp. PDM13]|uniref:substrate-binding periplasmic protein n=1 Tax=Pseudomonas sp. PDM13 TaxID=2769255 RepID=UPI0021E0127F|nr:transporter substrate-binding domain-containing protein [Pseudomonas sp. PDM13]MCU9950588.1 transporter substrate-binding domain-containing protein [Pseudomonas sp. PDM13]
MKGLFTRLLLSAALAIQAAGATELRLLTDNHPPLHFERDGELVGFAVDLVRELARETGDSIQLERLPLLRALVIAREGPDVAVFTILRTPEREADYRLVGPVLEVETALYALADHTPAIAGLDNARKVQHIAMPRKWLVYRRLQEMGFTNLYGVDTPEQMMRLLRLGRTELVAADTLSVATLAREEGLAPQQLRYVAPVMHQGSYIAFSRQTDAHIVARWQQSLEKVRADGRLVKLERKWLGGPR